MASRKSKGTSAVAVVIWCLAGLVGAGFLLFPFYGGCYRQPAIADLSNVKQLMLGNLMYMADNDGNGPKPDEWMDALESYIKNDQVFRSVDVSYDRDEYGFAYLEKLGGVRFEDVVDPADVPVIFNSDDLSRNATGGFYLLPNPPRWESGNNFAFLDGHARMLKTAPKFTIELQLRNEEDARQPVTPLISRESQTEPSQSEPFPLNQYLMTPK